MLRKKIAVLWAEGPISGDVSVVNGRLCDVGVVGAGGSATDCRFDIDRADRGKLVMEVEMLEKTQAKRTIVTLQCVRNTFSFFAGDIHRTTPVYIPQYGAAVTEGDDPRSYSEIERDIQAKGLKTVLQHIENEPEETYDRAATHTRELACHTWLGLSRDMRIFGVGFRGVGGEERLWDWVQPRFHAQEVTLPESGGQPVKYRFMIGRGVGCVDDISRRLEEGALPILHATLRDDDIAYHCTSFVSNEYRSLQTDSLRGTHFLVADGHSRGFMQTEQQAAWRESLMPEEMNRDEETILYFRAVATNTADVPRYAWFKNIVPNAEMLNNNKNYSFDGEKGFVRYAGERVCGVSKLNGSHLAMEETAVLLQPGASAVFEIFVPHRPISEERAFRLIRQDFQARLEECRSFWKFKQASSAQVRLPEKRIEEMTAAGLLHLDLVTYGLEPDGTLHPTIGIYPAIGSESAPIIQFMDSMGWKDTAERTLRYFLDKQHDSGFMQNFGGYMLETGAVLWSIGEHWRYTQDVSWVREIMPKLWKAYDFIVQWRERNKLERFRGTGYGMLEGKTADPEDPYHSFMLNGYAYMGLSRLAEILETVHPSSAEEIRREAEMLKRDIRESFDNAMARSPVVPLGDGSWVPTAPPWAEHAGPLALFAEPGKWLSHATFFIRDSILGPLYLAFQEVLDPCEDAVSFMLSYHSELMCARNVAFSQPYYSIHPWVHLKRWEVKAFLKAYYNGFTGLADRQTYTFWEHYWHASPHKTHEEGWFLMQTRWMLYMEEGQTIRLLPGIPRAWMEHGKIIELKRMASYFGLFDLFVESQLEQGVIIASATFDASRTPELIILRIPHPHKIKPVRVEGGTYLPEIECVRVKPVEGAANVKLYYM